MTNAMPTVDDFNEILKKHGLKPCYRFDAAETERQMTLPSVKPILTAFDEGVAALFVINDSNRNRDNMVLDPKDNPEEWGLNENPSDEDVTRVLKAGLNEDSKLTIALIPEVIDPEGDLHQPEYRESVTDYWIWHIYTGVFFPGPLWMLVKRDGTEPAFHYGYM